MIHNDGVVIGEDPGGDAMVMRRDGAIVIAGLEADDVGGLAPVAGSFSELLSEVLMGKRFPELFAGEVGPSVENEWTEHLRRQGWL